MFYNNNNYQHRRTAKSIKMHRKVLRALGFAFLFVPSRLSHSDKGPGLLYRTRHCFAAYGFGFRRRTERNEKTQFPSCHVYDPRLPGRAKRREGKKRCGVFGCRSCLSFYATAAIFEGRSIKYKKLYVSPGEKVKRLARDRCS